MSDTKWSAKGRFLRNEITALGVCDEFEQALKLLEKIEQSDVCGCDGDHEAHDCWTLEISQLLAQHRVEEEPEAEGITHGSSGTDVVNGMQALRKNVAELQAATTGPWGLEDMKGGQIAQQDTMEEIQADLKRLQSEVADLRTLEDTNAGSIVKLAQRADANANLSEKHDRALRDLMEALRSWHHNDEEPGICEAIRHTINRLDDIESST